MGIELEKAMDKGQIELGAVPLGQEIVIKLRDLRELLAEADDLDFSGPVSGEIRFYRNDDEVYLYGTVTADIVLACSRCLGNTIKHTEKRFTYRFISFDDVCMEKDIALQDEDVEMAWYKNDVIDLTELFEEQIRLEIPVRILCSNDCLGLCAMCGCDLNVSECACIKEGSNTVGPFAMLAEQLAIN